MDLSTNQSRSDTAAGDSSTAGSLQSLQPVAMDMSVSMGTTSDWSQPQPSLSENSEVSGVTPMTTASGRSAVLQSQLSGSSGVTEYSVTGESPVRPGTRSDSLLSSSLGGSQGAISVGPNLPESSPVTPPSQGISGSSQSQADPSYQGNTSSSEIGSLDLTRVESRSLDLSSGRSSESSTVPVAGPSGPPDLPLSMDTDGSLDLSKSAAALSTLQPVPTRPSATANSRYRSRQ